MTWADNNHTAITHIQKESCELYDIERQRFELDTKPGLFCQKGPMFIGLFPKRDCDFYRAYGL